MLYARIPKKNKVSRLILPGLILLLLACKGSQKSTAESATKGLGKNPYYVLDSKPTTSDVLDIVNPKDVAAVTILDKRNGRTAFGKKARDGAVLIETYEYANSLYNHVDSLIVSVLGYNYIEDVIPRNKNLNNSTDKHVNTSNLALPPNPEPPILLDGKIVTKESLKGKAMDSVGTIECWKPGEKAFTLFGALATNGAIIITTKDWEKANGQKN